jgi:hypothetical protein
MPTCVSRVQGLLFNGLPTEIVFLIISFFWDMNQALHPNLHEFTKVVLLDKHFAGMFSPLLKALTHPTGWFQHYLRPVEIRLTMNISNQVFTILNKYECFYPYMLPCLFWLDNEVDTTQYLPTLGLAFTETPMTDEDRRHCLYYSFMNENEVGCQVLYQRWGIELFRIVLNGYFGEFIGSDDMPSYTPLCYLLKYLLFITDDKSREAQDAFSIIKLALEYAIEHDNPWLKEICIDNAPGECMGRIGAYIAEVKAAGKYPERMRSMSFGDDDDDVE